MAATIAKTSLILSVVVDVNLEAAGEDLHNFQSLNVRYFCGYTIPGMACGRKYEPLLL
jgi:hypothetical protein